MSELDRAEAREAERLWSFVGDLRADDVPTTLPADRELAETAEALSLLHRATGSSTSHRDVARARLLRVMDDHRARPTPLPRPWRQRLGEWLRVPTISMPAGAILCIAVMVVTGWRPVGLPGRPFNLSHDTAFYESYALVGDYLPGRYHRQLFGHIAHCDRCWAKYLTCLPANHGAAGPVGHPYGGQPAPSERSAAASAADRAVDRVLMASRSR
jgi:hypothetical protein